MPVVGRMYVFLSLLVFVEWQVLVSGCGGEWKQEHSTIVADEEYSVCDYSDLSTEGTPDGIRSDTQFLRMNRIGLSDSSLSISSIRSEVKALIALEMDSNHLTKIPDVSSFNATLAFLSLELNELTSVNLNDFSVCPNLRTLELRHNKIVNLTLSEPITLINLYLRDNRITEIDMNIFSFTNILTLDISTNPLINVTYATPSSQITIEALYANKMDNYFINKIAPYITENLDHIKLCSFTQNQRTVFNISNFSHMQSLETLYLNANPIASIQPMPYGVSMTKLTNLELKSCSLGGALNLTMFTNHPFPMLYSLDFESNQIESVFIENGQILPKLTVLRLGYNSIQQMDLQFYIISTPRMKHLYLNQNYIRKIMFPENGVYHPTLRYLHLENNPLVSMSSYCHSYFDTSATTVRMYLTGTDLRCDACIVWLVSCPYNLYADDPVCAAPKGLRGMAVSSAAPYLMDIPCIDESDNSLFFMMKSHNASDTPIVSMETMRGRHQCALKTKLANGRSFDYDEPSHICNIYEGGGGTFEAL